jgi:hypothetical protein
MPPAHLPRDTRHSFETLLFKVPRDLVCFDSNLPCGIDALCSELKLSLSGYGQHGGAPEFTTVFL